MKNSLFGEVPLLRLAVCLMAGIVMGDSLGGGIWLWWLMVMAVVTTIVLWRYALLQSVAIAGCFVLLGWLLTVRQEASLRVQWPEGEVVYEAVVFSEPVEKPKTMAVDIMLVKSGQKIKGYLYKDARSRGLKIGDGLRIQSRINANSDWRRGAFDYRRYLETHGFTGSTFVSSWKWRKARVSLKGLSRLERTRLFFLKQRSLLLQRFVVEGQDNGPYAVLAAMALGDKSALTKELKDVYAVTGASHVLALSGLHLGIIYALLSLLVVGRRWQMVLSLYDVGFLMSFMAVFAILVLMPLMMGVFPMTFLLSHQAVRWVWSMVAVSCAAQIGVAPLIAYYFGRFSTYFLLTNFIVIPAATLILWLSPVVLVFPSLAYLLLYIVGLLNAILTKMAAIPWASIEGLHPTKLQTAMMYVIIAACYLLVKRLLPMLTCSRASEGYR